MAIFTLGGIAIDVTYTQAGASIYTTQAFVEGGEVKVGAPGSASSGVEAGVVRVGALSGVVRAGVIKGNVMH